MTTSVLSTTNNDHGTGLTVYSGVNAWVAACPSDISAAGGSPQIWKAVAYNDGVFSSVSTVSGITTDVNNYLWLTAADGESFADDPSTDTLTYKGTSAGVTFEVNTGYTILLTIQTHFLLERIQIKTSGAGSFSLALGSSPGIKANNCIIGSQISGHGGTWVNCLFVLPNVNNGFSTSRFEFCTFISTTGASGLGSSSFFQTVTFENCAIFNWTSGISLNHGSTTAGDYNCTDLASAGSNIPGAHSLYSKTFANQFESTVNDFREKVGADLIGAGTPATTYTTTDIRGNSRNATTPTIGVSELPSGTSTTKGRISFTEFETPSLITKGRLSFTEFEVPLKGTKGRVSFTEFEAPFLSTRGRISQATLEIPFIATKGRISQSELEVPLVGTRGRISFVEVEAPLVHVKGRIGFTELQVPSANPDPTKGQISQLLLEVPALVAKGRLSHLEFEIPLKGTRGLISFTEMEVPIAQAKGRIAWVDFRVPDFGATDESLNAMSGLYIIGDIDDFLG